MIADASPLVNLDDRAATLPAGGGSDRFASVLAAFGQQIGLGGLDVRVVAVEPGIRAAPFHTGAASDEMFVILHGEGLYRCGGDDFPVKPGDVCAVPRGGPEVAHQIVNTGSKTLRYLGISTEGAAAGQRPGEVLEGAPLGDLEVFKARLRQFGDAGAPAPRHAGEEVQ